MLKIRGMMIQKPINHRKSLIVFGIDVGLVGSRLVLLRDGEPLYSFEYMPEVAFAMQLYARVFRLWQDLDNNVMAGCRESGPSCTAVWTLLCKVSYKVSGSEGRKFV